MDKNLLFMPKIIFKTLLLIIFSFNINCYAGFKSDNKNIITFNSDAGIKLLETSRFKNDFYTLINFYQPQINPIYCSAATATTILNALNYNNISNQKHRQILKPLSQGGGVIKYHLYDQEHFFNNKTDKIKNINIINFKIPKKITKNKAHYDPGVTLSEFSKILSNIYDLDITKKHVTNSSKKDFNQFKQDLINNLNNKNKFIVANFHGKKLKLKTHGHISPIIAYNEQNNKILIMDVALHKQLWYWADIKKFYNAMKTKDGKNYRGYLIISKK